MADAKSDVDHRQFGVDLYNYTWTLLEKADRSRDDDDEMLNATHASAYHWNHAAETGPQNAARGHWQISRVNAVLGRGEAALYHAERCLQLCTENGIGDWDIAAAYEAVARAHKLAGDDAEFRRNLELGREALAQIANEEDREHIAEDLDALAS
jgi:hypothetical protein